MRKIKEIILFTLCFSLTGTLLYAQQAVPATGGIASGTNGTECYTVGQVFYLVETGTGGNNIEGVQQSYEWLTVIQESNSLNSNCSAYPNPVTGFLTLKVNDSRTENLTYCLYDVKGKIVVNEKIMSSETFINMKEISQGTYFLKVENAQNEVTTFKIIKN